MPHSPISNLQSPLDELVTAVLHTPKYHTISPDLVRRVGERELAARRNVAEAVKATKNKLHQVGGAYFASKVNYEKALERLQETADLPHTCRDLMRLHTSTQERLPILDTFYTTTLAGLPPIHKVLDIACGFNPLARPWMPFTVETEYIACDIYSDMIAFIEGFFALAGVRGRAEVRDVISQPITETADLTLLLKLLPVLEQVDKTAVPRLLDSLQSRYLLISFPVHSLGGRHKGMAENYEEKLMGWLNGRSWAWQKFLFSTELAFLVSCGAGD